MEQLLSLRSQVEASVLALEAAKSGHRAEDIQFCSDQLDEALGRYAAARARVLESA